MNKAPEKEAAKVLLFDEMLKNISCPLSIALIPNLSYFWFKIFDVNKTPDFQELKLWVAQDKIKEVFNEFKK